MSWGVPTLTCGTHGNEGNSWQGERTPCVMLMCSLGHSYSLLSWMGPLTIQKKQAVEIIYF